MIARALLVLAWISLLPCWSHAQRVPGGTSTEFQAEGAFWAVVVADLDASERWYTENLSLHRIKKSRAPNGSAEASILEGHGIYVELVHFLDEKSPATQPEEKDRRFRPGIFKAGITVSPQVFDQLREHLRQTKAQFVGDVFADKEMEVRSFIVKDNSGNLVQFFARENGQETSR